MEVLINFLKLSVLLPGVTLFAQENRPKSRETRCGIREETRNANFCWLSQTSRPIRDKTERAYLVQCILTAGAFHLK